MNFNIRAYKQSDYEILSSWWRGWSWPLVPKECLPQTGYIIDDLCAGFLYKTDSSIAWMEWIISNPKADKFVRGEALDVLIVSLIEKAKEQGFSSIFTSSNKLSFKDRLIKHKFIETDKDVSQFIRSL